MFSRAQVPSPDSLSLSRRRMLLGAGVTAGALFGALPAAASGAQAATARPATAYDVSVAPDTITAPAAVPSGPVTFNVGTATAGGLALPLVKLRVPVAKYLADLNTLSKAATPAEAAAAEAAVEAGAVNLGGGVVQPGTGVAFTQILTPGTYHLVAYDFDGTDVHPVAHTLTVKGPASGSPPDAVDCFAHTPTGFDVPGGRLKAAGTHYVVNRSGLLNEAVLIPVRPGTTAAGIDAFFEALRGGTQPPSYPLIGGPVGLPPLSPNRSALLTTSLAPGGYLLSSWITSTTTGHSRALDGFYKLVTLT
ncbi:hypothetical protein RB628_11340 [Streptomyces sp. ADMS]|uniref:hypothetical protein n=1 Tax=Streptomyces sp. ADMS TaxID=3071415 RepID=UPI00296FC4BE|nr:hypothetical protein [Streptomyces sp. ADMS]MDW4905911.1 hypothetical protein [Streptomyces sp. ADMS]